MNKTFFPVIFRSISSNVGSQIEGNFLGQEELIVPGRVYQIPVYWNSDKDYTRQFAALQGNKIGAGIRQVPPQYRLWPEYAGSPPNPEGYLALAKFICECIQKYGLDFIEIFNEVNVDRDLARPHEYYFGAWISKEISALDAGKMYADMLAVVYPYVKKRFPHVSIHAGAMMLNDNTLAFLRGMGNKNLDAITFHYYLTEETPFRAILDVIAELKSVVQAEFLCSETAVLGQKDTDALRRRQAEWMRYIREGNVPLKMVLHYTFFDNTWGCCSMVQHGIPKPVYDEYKMDTGI